MNTKQASKKAIRGNPPVPPLLEEEAKKYMESHPEVAEYFRLVDSTFGAFGKYLSLTQSRLVVQEIAGGSNAEAEFSAALSSTHN